MSISSAKWSSPLKGNAWDRRHAICSAEPLPAKRSDAARPRAAATKSARLILLEAHRGPVVKPVSLNYWRSIIDKLSKSARLRFSGIVTQVQLWVPLTSFNPQNSPGRSTYMAWNVWPPNIADRFWPFKHRVSNEWHIYAACLFPDLWLTNGFKRYPTENPDQFLEEQHLLLAAIIPNKNNKLVGRFRIPEKLVNKKACPRAWPCRAATANAKSRSFRICSAAQQMASRS